MKKYKIIKLWEAQAPHEEPFVIEKQNFFGFYERLKNYDDCVISFKSKEDAEMFLKRKREPITVSI